MERHGEELTDGMRPRPVVVLVLLPLLPLPVALKPRRRGTELERGVEGVSGVASPLCAVDDAVLECCSVREESVGVSECESDWPPPTLVERCSGLLDSCGESV